MGIDIVSRIRNLLNFGTKENSLKRRADDDEPDYYTLPKYRRVSSDFPKVINKPFEDDSMFARPKMSDNSVTSKPKSNGNCSNVNNFIRSNFPLYADIEFSDNEDDFIPSSQRGKLTSTNLINFPTTTTKHQRRSYRPDNDLTTTQPRERIVPIRMERKPPPLIEARTGDVISPISVPNLHPIRKGSIMHLFNNNQEMTNGFGSDIATPQGKFGVSTPASRNDSKSIKTSTFYSKSPNSVVAKTYDLKSKRGYLELLSQLVPSLYQKDSSRRSTSKRISLGRNQDVVEQIDLTKPRQKGSKIINLDDDDDEFAKEVIDLDDDDVQMISACRKLSQSKAKEPPKKQLPAVQPVNSLRDKLENNPKLHPQWLQQFKKKSDENKRISRQKIAEEEENARKLSDETGRVERIITQKLKDFTIDYETVVLDESESEEEIEFPELTDNDVALIKKAIYRGPGDEVLVSKFNMQITRRDITTLIDGNWLNDEVINFYMNLLIDRGEERQSEGLPRVYAMNTFFVVRLMNSGYSSVRRWTRKIDIFSYDIIPVPVHVGGVHWCMAIIHLRDKYIKYYDSMGTPNPKVLQALEDYIKEESLDKRKERFDTSDFIKESVRDVPKQMNGSDCGVFSCMFAEYITRNRDITFSQQHMPYFRQKMILEICQGKLLL